MHIHVTVHFIGYFHIRGAGVRQLLSCTHSYMLKHCKKKNKRKKSPSYAELNECL